MLIFEGYYDRECEFGQILPISAVCWGLSAVRGYRSPVQPDPALSAQVSDDTEMDLGTYPEAAVAVVGANPGTGSLDPSLEKVESSFRRLDTQARKAAMQSALGQLIRDGTLDLPGQADLEKVVKDGLHGRLAVSGPMARLYDLSYWFRRQFRAGVVIAMWTSGGLGRVRMPDGICAPGLESCFALPPARGEPVSVLLVERRDPEAGTLSYTLRTVRREFIRMAGFLFADVTTPGEGLAASAYMRFRIGPTNVTVKNEFVRKDGETTAAAQITGSAQGAFSPRAKSRSGRVTYHEMTDSLAEDFAFTAARTR
jgi:hypothetical protein